MRERVREGGGGSHMNARYQAVGQSEQHEQCSHREEWVSEWVSDSHKNSPGKRGRSVYSSATIPPHAHFEVFMLAPTADMGCLQAFVHIRECENGSAKNGINVLGAVRRVREAQESVQQRDVPDRWVSYNWGTEATPQGRGTYQPGREKGVSELSNRETFHRTEKR